MTGKFLVLPSLMFAVALAIACTKSPAEISQPAPSPAPVTGIQMPPGGVPVDHPPEIRWLSEVEVARVVEIALNTPPAMERRQKGISFATSLGWVAIVWKDASRTEYSEYRTFPYEAVETGIPRGRTDVTPPGSKEKVVMSGVPQEAIFYPQVVIHFGQEWVVQVAVDLKGGKAVLVEDYPNLSSPDRFRIPPPPSK